jgi:hypothetical protein
VQPRTTIILGPFASEPFAQGLRSLLVGIDNFDVVSVDSLDGDIEINTASILIVEGTDPAECNNYLDELAVRSVVLFDPRDARAFVGLENPNWRQLAQVVRSLAGRVWADQPVDSDYR